MIDYEEALRRYQAKNTALEEEVIELQGQIGMAAIHTESVETWLISCEKALVARDSEVLRLRDEIAKGLEDHADTGRYAFKLRKALKDILKVEVWDASIYATQHIAKEALK